MQALSSSTRGALNRGGVVLTICKKMSYIALKEIIWVAPVVNVAAAQLPQVCKQLLCGVDVLLTPDCSQSQQQRLPTATNSTRNR